MKQLPAAVELLFVHGRRERGDESAAQPVRVLVLELCEKGLAVGGDAGELVARLA